jgi:fructose-bisphosphate aldolase class 1
MTTTDLDLTARAIVADGKRILAADETQGTLTKRLAWGGREDNVPAAQRAFYHRARGDAAAANGQYSCAMEAPSAVA